LGEDGNALIPIITIGGLNVISTLIDFGISTFIYLIVALTVNLEFGYTGVPNFGKVLFVAAGGLIGGSLSYYLMAYILGIHSSALLTNQFIYHNEMDKALIGNPALDAGLLLFMIVMGAAFGALFGYLASYPAIKLREDYLGMFLLAAGEFFLVFVQSYAPITNGTSGLNIPDVLGFTGNVLDYRKIVLFGLLAIVTAGVYFYAERVARSPLGRTLRAVRDNEMSSESLGKNNIAIRRNILIVGSALSGIAGVFVAIQSSFISPDTFTRTFFTFYPFVIVILGGAANNFAVVVGAITFEGILDGITNFQTYAAVHNINIPVDLNAVTPIAIGALLIVILMWRPRGLISEKPTRTLKKSELVKIKENMKKAEPQRLVASEPQIPANVQTDPTASLDSEKVVPD
jgi:branched-chain amino acid transport system permease protein